MANQEHLDRLLQGMEAWNQWRQDHLEVEPDLSGANLFGANLFGANLFGASLFGADLSFADLTAVDLIGASLNGANLWGANLSRANLSRANLRYANLRYANLSGAILTAADLSHANLGRADLVDAILESANLEGANLEGAYRFSKDRDLEQLVGQRSAASAFDEEGWDLVFTASDEDSRFPPSVSDYLGIPDAPPPPTDPAFCHVHAEMDERVIVQRVTTVEVIVSREALDHITSAASQGGTIELHAEQRLIVQVIPKTNFIVVGTDRLEVDPPEKDKPHLLYFDLRATHMGDGEVWVVLRQSQQSLLTLVLQPKIVKDRAAMRPTAAAQPLVAPLVSTPDQSSIQRLSASGSATTLPTPSAPLHQLRIVERRNGTQLTYWYELSAPQLGVLSLHESKPITSDRTEYVEQLYKELESRWLSTQADVADFAAELRAFGGQLFDQLFPEALQQQLWHHRAQLDSIMVISTEPFIPWELVHLKPPGQNHLPDETCFLGQRGLVRWLHDVGFPLKASLSDQDMPTTSFLTTSTNAITCRKPSRSRSCWSNGSTPLR